MESMSASLEAERKAKGEALRVKKALDGEINELKIGLDHASKANSEGLKSIKRYQGQLTIQLTIQRTIQLYEDEARDEVTAGNVADELRAERGPPHQHAARLLIGETRLFQRLTLPPPPQARTIACIP